METTNNDKHLSKRGNEKRNGIGFAVALILIGGIFLLFNTGVIPTEYRRLLISWQMLLIMMGIWSLIKRSYTSAIILIGIGVVFIYPTLSSLFPQFFIDINFDWHTYWPVVLIIIGLLLIAGKTFKFHKSDKGNERDYNRPESGKHNCSGSRYGDQNNTDFIDKNVIFSSAEQIILTQGLKGGEANVIFGELIIDLRKAQLAEGNNLLELNVIFGSIVVYVPSDWIVELQTNTIFGSFQDRRYMEDEIIDSQSTSCLVIKGNAVMASGEIKN